MADNYLEKRMEELQSGKTMHTARHESEFRGLKFPFSNKRILLASSNRWIDKIALMFMRTGCKVAAIQVDSINTSDSTSGVRRYALPPECTTQEYEDYLTVSFRNLLESWRDLDVLIADREIINHLLPLWARHRETNPYLFDYKTRIIILDKSGQNSRLPQIDVNFRASINVIEGSGSTDISALVAMLVLPANGFISNMKFQSN